MTVRVIAVQIEIGVEGVGVLYVELVVEFVGDEENDAADEVSNHDGNEHQSEDVVDVHDKVLLNDRRVVGVLFLEPFQELIESPRVDKLDQSRQPT